MLSLKTDGKVRVAGKRKVLALGSKAFQALKGQQVVRQGAEAPALITVCPVVG